MTTEELLKEYEKALESQALANYSAEQTAIAVKVLQFRLEMQIKHGITSEASFKPESTKLPTRTELFIKKHAKLLSADDRAFLEKESRPTREVADYLVSHRNHPAEALNKGIYRPGRGDRTDKRMVDTISVIEHILKLNDQTDQEPKRNL